eukprot:TRINITY_DN51334_c0_g1_i1.p1 TRINITY_DN51334_c0_g1~~TRINITY_DN51334_c0_g1_i1.p1  ORF type:complete len:130 (-),score=55.27 TRINITY_DN51334_c0_g1_i1:17-406(-)
MCIRDSISVSEVSRLAHFVKLHDEECRVSVRGAFVLNEKTGKLVKNRTFSGLEVEQARKLRSFLKVSSFPAIVAEKIAAANKAANEIAAVSYTHLRAHETPEHLVCRLLLEKKNKIKQNQDKRGDQNTQ